MSSAAGLLLASVCGILSGSFLAPMPRLKIWRWENFWLVWSVVGLLIGPFLTVVASVPGAGDMYGNVSARALWATTVVGAVAGTSGFLYSRSVPAIGFGLATALDSGSGLAVGTLVPFFHEHLLHSSLLGSVLSLTAIAIAVVGIGFCGKGGHVRVSERRPDSSQVTNRGSRSHMTFFKGLSYSILGGAVASCMNLGLVFQGEIANAARTAGASAFGVSSAFLAPYLLGSFLSNFVYAGVLARRNQTASLLYQRGTGSDWLWSACMGAMFALAMASYSGSIALLGPFGTVVGWGLKTAVTIVVSSAWDLRRGEWKSGGRNFMLLGVLLLLTAVALLVMAQTVYSAGMPAH